MLKIKYTRKMKRMAFMGTNRGPVEVGEVEEFEKNGDDESLVVKFHDKIPEGLVNQVQQNPSLLVILEVPDSFGQVFILPSSSLITPL